MNKNPKTGKFMKKNPTPAVAPEATEAAVATPEVETTEVAETTAETTEAVEATQETAKAVEATATAEAGEAPKAEKKEKANAVQKTVKVTTTAHLQVFSKKTIDEETASKMRPGAELILEFLEATAQNGEQLVRVRKDGSTRTFYTTNAHVQEVIA
jgi:hypothetical protein